MPNARSPRQSYCTKPECQRERRRLWQQLKRRTDPDYLENQMRAQQAWRERNPMYWSSYRASHPDYAKRNRDQQRQRRAAKLAKMDATATAPLATGLYQLQVLDAAGVTKMEPIVVRITVLAASVEIGEIAKRGRDRC
jgi:hypothetical protein